MNDNVKDMTLVELKALAFDHLRNIEMSQVSLKRIGEEITKRTASNGREEERLDRAGTPEDGKP